LRGIKSFAKGSGSNPAWGDHAGAGLIDLIKVNADGAELGPAFETIETHCGLTKRH